MAVIPFEEAFTSAATLINSVVNKIWPSPEEKAKAEVSVLIATATAALEMLKQQMSVMLAEAMSPDKWTSRARPTFLYVMYIMILICIPFGILWAFEPILADRMAEGMRKWLSAIPDGLWATFGIGYTGYSVSRSYEKGKGVAK